MHKDLNAISDQSDLDSILDFETHTNTNVEKNHQKKVFYILYLFLFLILVVYSLQLFKKL